MSTVRCENPGEYSHLLARLFPEHIEAKALPGWLPTTHVTPERILGTLGLPPLTYEEVEVADTRGGDCTEFLKTRMSQHVLDQQYPVLVEFSATQFKHQWHVEYEVIPLSAVQTLDQYLESLT